MESRDGRRTCKRGPSPSATPKHSVPHLLNNEPSYAGGGLDGVNTSYAAQHKRQHVGSAIGQDIGVPSSPCSAPDHSRSTLERQAAVVQSAYRRLGGTLLPCFAAASSAVHCHKLHVSFALNDILLIFLLHLPADKTAEFVTQVLHYMDTPTAAL